MHKGSEKQKEIFPDDSMSISGSSKADYEMFKLAIENVDEHVVITDSDGVILYANKAAEKTTGYSFSEMSGKTPALWGRQMSADFYKKMWDQIKVKKAHFSGEFINKRKNGELYTAWGKISPVVDRQGTLSYFIAIERDITKEKRADEEKVKQIEELEQMNKLMVDRELKMAELKDENKRLRGEGV